MNQQTVLNLRKVFSGFSYDEQSSDEMQQGGFLSMGFSFPITSFFLSPSEIRRFGNIVFPYKVETVAGMISDHNGQTLHSVQIRTPISIVPDSSYNEAFVHACWSSCDSAFEHFNGVLDISYNVKLYNGLVMLFSNINEEAFLSQDINTEKKIITYFMQQLSQALSYIRKDLANHGYSSFL